MARSFTLTICDGSGQHISQAEHFTCRRLETAYAHGAKRLAETNGTIARLEYAALGPRHTKVLFQGVWRNGYHHQRALARAA